MAFDLPIWVKPGVTFRDESGPLDRHVVWHVLAMVDDIVVMRRPSTQPGSDWVYACENGEFFSSRSRGLRIVAVAPPVAIDR